MALSQHTTRHLGTEFSVIDSLPLNSALSSSWDFIRPTKKLRTGILDTAKVFLDSLASSVHDAQASHQRSVRKRKRLDDDRVITPTLGFKQLHVDGFSVDQIWEQSYRIFDSTDAEIHRDYSCWAYDAQKPVFQPSKNGEPLGSSSNDGAIPADDPVDEPEDSLDEYSVGGVQTGRQHSPEGELDQGNSNECDWDGGSATDQNESHGTYVEDRFGLNDGFFSIDDFNKQTELLEREDVWGIVDGQGDEDEINWDADPLDARGSSAPSMKMGDGSEYEESEVEEEGLNFGEMSAHGHSDEDEDGAQATALQGAGVANTSDIMYADFFEPPLRKVSSKSSRPLPKTQPRHVASNDDIDHAMADVHRDIFIDEVSAEDSDDEPSHNMAHRSSHEKQRARITDEIRRLEAANVAKKEWIVSGEARAPERPTNSLIEEDLDFERLGKPVSVVTTELSERIEELIKRRIIAKEFDEVIRRRPGALDRQGTQEARVDLEDSKPQQGLAEIYEADHLRAVDPNHVDSKNQKLLKEHAEIANLWHEIGSQLDTLSNWHYKPKAPQANINVVTDVATITLEDAQPTVNGAADGSANLAPQEIYAPGETTRVDGEFVMRNGVPATKEEMTRDEKAKLRRRQKKLNQAPTESSKKRSGIAVEKQQVVSDLRRAGVRLIGKEGDMKDISGAQIAGVGNRDGAHSMKL